ncbi:MAG: hypothetical protein NWE98_02190 [Candidatus Bathyarchaeota archaeon]|nr:hypothetical protein [Candidatus Bathyarchaeota archaeon]
MMEIIQSAKVGNDKIIKIAYDDTPLNPFEEFDFLGTWIGWHRNYLIGKKEERMTQTEFSEFVKEQRNKILILNLYCYEHGGIMFSTDNTVYPFNDRWDSGQIGYIYVTYEKIKKEFNVKHVTKKTIQKCKKIIQAEIDTVNKIFNGEIYGYVIYRIEKCNKNHTHLEHEDSCWGYIGLDSIKETLESMGYVNVEWQDGDVEA